MMLNITNIYTSIVSVVASIIAGNVEGVDPSKVTGETPLPQIEDFRRDIVAEFVADIPESVWDGLTTVDELATHLFNELRRNLQIEKANTIEIVAVTSNQLADALNTANGYSAARGELLAKAVRGEKCDQKTVAEAMRFLQHQDARAAAIINTKLAEGPKLPKQGSSVGAKTK